MGKGRGYIWEMGEGGVDYKVVYKPQPQRTTVSTYLYVPFFFLVRGILFRRNL